MAIGQAGPSQDSDYTRALEMIDRLAELQPGWNSYRGAAINELACRRARDLVAVLREACPRVPAPEVGPTPTGGVLLHWDANTLEVEISIEPVGGSYSVAAINSPELLAHGDLDQVDPLKQVIRPYVLRV